MKNQQRVIFVLGGVFSGIGKGLITASIGKLFQDNQNRVLVQKNDSYLNFDTRFLNPNEHGEVFVTDDGTETDLDLGHYERFLNQNLTSQSLITSGRIYSKLLAKERQGFFQGRTIDFHQVANEIQKTYETWINDNPDNEIFLIEMGGTIGNNDLVVFLTAAKQMQRKYGNRQVVFVYLTYIFFLSSVQEFKTKIAQKSVRELRECAIEPDFVVLRSDRKIPQAILEKFRRIMLLDTNQVIVVPDQNIYFLPEYIKRHRLFDNLCQKLQITNLECSNDWLPIMQNFIQAKDVKPIKIAIVNKYVNFRQSYLSLFHALTIACNHHQISFDYTEINPESLTLTNYEKELAPFHGIIVPGGFGARGTEGKILAIQYARTHKVPFLGICLGNQLALIEFARNVLKIKTAGSREFQSTNFAPIIDYYYPQTQKMQIGAHPVHLKKGSLVHKIFNKDVTNERFRNRFGFNIQYSAQFRKHGFLPTGKNSAGRPEMWELPEHPFFVTTQFHLELISRTIKPHPLFLAFFKVCLQLKAK